MPWLPVLVVGGLVAAGIAAKNAAERREARRRRISELFVVVADLQGYGGHPALRYVPGLDGAQYFHGEIQVDDAWLETQAINAQRLLGGWAYTAVIVFILAHELAHWEDGHPPSPYLVARQREELFSDRRGGEAVRRFGLRFDAVRWLLSTFHGCIDRCDHLPPRFRIEAARRGYRS